MNSAGLTSDDLLAGELPACKKCRRLTRQLARLRSTHPDYWNRPVPGSGRRDARILIVGLAPGMHGANKTGRPFTGDASGDLLHDVLDELGLTHKVAITNAVKCLPVKNLPSAQEISNCSRYLRSELARHGEGRNPTLLALGGVAHRAIVKSLDLKQAVFPFRHGAVHRLGNALLVDSYHCSRYNTQTGRLTRRMFLDVMRIAAKMAYP